MYDFLLFNITKVLTKVNLDVVTQNMLLAKNFNMQMMSDDK